MGSGVSRTATGSFKGTGALVEIKTPGFRPSAVKLLNEGGLASADWTDSMADGDMLKRVTAGTLSKVATNGISPLAAGFSLGTDADMNVAGELVHYVAHE